MSAKSGRTFENSRIQRDLPARSLIISFLIAAVIIFCALPGTGLKTHANETYISGGCYLYLDGETLVVSRSDTGNGYMADYALNMNTPYYNIAGKIKKVEVRKGVQGIGRNAFSSLNGLRSVSLPYGLKKIGDNAFFNTGLQSVVIPSTVESIGNSAFQACTSMESITLPSKLTSIGKSSFEKTGLISIVIPGKVTSIGKNAFINCSSLTEVAVNATVPPVISYSAFDGCSKLTTIKIPVGTKSAYKIANGWDNYAECFTEFVPAPEPEDEEQASAQQGGSSQGQGNVPTGQGGSSWGQGSNYPAGNAQVQTRDNAQVMSGGCGNAGKSEILVYDSYGNNYKVLSDGKSLALKKAVDRKEVIIPYRVKVNGRKLPVTQILKKSFAGKKIATVKINCKNISKFDKNAFKGAKKLKSVKLKGLKRDSKCAAQAEKAALKWNKKVSVYYKKWVEK